MDFEIVEILVIVDKEIYRFQFHYVKFLDIVDFFEIVDDLLLTDEATISRFHCSTICGSLYI